jgi:hypothetical protein
VSARALRVAFVQPFGFGSPAGGPRILRALAEEAPAELLSFAVGVEAPPPTDAAAERFLPLRPRTPLDGTRFGRWTGPADLAALPLLRRRLRAALLEAAPDVVHVIPHAIDLVAVRQAVNDLGLPFVLNVHDDVGYNLRGRPEQPLALKALARAWRQATARVVISPAMGNEYDRRYGARPWCTVTDGAPALEQRSSRGDDALVVYFMGSLHISYTATIESLLGGLDAIGSSARFICRGGRPPIGDHARLEVRPYADEAAVQADLDDVDIVYLPLPFGREHTDFVRLSLPTKLVTYLASGRPLLVHGPADSTSAALVRAHDAGVVIDSLDAQAVRRGVLEARARAGELVANAQRLAATAFDIDQQRDRFWRVMRDAAASRSR